MEINTRHLAQKTDIQQHGNADMENSTSRKPRQQGYKNHKYMFTHIQIYRLFTSDTCTCLHIFTETSMSIYTAINQHKKKEIWMELNPNKYCHHEILKKKNLFKL